MTVKHLLLGSWISLVTLHAPLAAQNTGKNGKPIRVDEVLKQELPSPKQWSICTDSYLSESPRSWVQAERKTDEECLARIAETFERVRFRAGSFQLLRHGRWYDPTFTRLRGEDSGKLLQKTVVRRNGPPNGTAVTVKVETLRATLGDLCRALQKETGEQHAALGWIAERRITLITPNTTTADLRAALARLFVDSRWVKDQQTWLIKERPDAERIRKISETEAKRSRRFEEWAEAGLKTQIASDLSGAQWHQLEDGGTVTLAWDELSAGGKSLLVGWGNAFADTILVRSNGVRENFADMRRTQDLSIQVRLLGGRMKVTSFGRTTSGMGVIW